MSTKTVSPQVVNQLSDDLGNKIANNEDRIQEKLESKLLSDDSIEDSIRNLAVPNEFGSINPSDFDDSQHLRSELNSAVNTLRNQLYDSSDRNTVRRALSELGLEIESQGSADINTKKQFNKFVSDDRGEHIMVAPGDEIFFLASVGAGVLLLLFVTVVYAIDAFIGSSAAGTLVVLAAGSFLATVAGIALHKTYKMLKSLWQVIR